jgi:hypothetical protein
MMIERVFPVDWNLSGRRKKSFFEIRIILFKSQDFKLFGALNFDYAIQK